MVQWWEHPPPTNVAQVWFSNPASYVGWVFCWFSTLLREVYLRALQFSPLLKNQHFQIWSWNAQTFLNKFLWTPWCSVVKQITFLWVLTMLQGFFSGFSGFPPNISTFQFNKDKATCIYHPWLKLWKEIVVNKFLLQNKNTIGHVQGKVYWNIIWENANLLVPNRLFWYYDKMSFHEAKIKIPICKSLILGLKNFRVQPEDPLSS